MAIMSNIPLLVSDMERKDKAVETVRFSHKAQGYYLTICVLEKEERDKYQRGSFRPTVLIRLIRRERLDEYLEFRANAARTDVDIVELRRFLGVSPVPNLFDWYRDFLRKLNDAIPSEYVVLDAKTERVSLDVICQREGRDFNRTYRFYMFRNASVEGVQKHRSLYNGQLASVVFPNIYRDWKRDKEVSFAFTDDAAKEKTEQEVLDAFIDRERRGCRGFPQQG